MLSPQESLCACWIHVTVAMPTAFIYGLRHLSVSLSASLCGLRDKYDHHCPCTLKLCLSDQLGMLLPQGRRAVWLLAVIRYSMLGGHAVLYLQDLDGGEGGGHSLGECAPLLRAGHGYLREDQAPGSFKHNKHWVASPVLLGMGPALSP